MTVRPLFLCFLTDAAARSVVDGLAREEGATLRFADPRELTQLVSEAELGRLAGIVTDLRPTTVAHLAQLHRARALRPSIPILLYLPATPGAVELAARAAIALPGVRAAGQWTDHNERERIRAFLRDAAQTLTTNQVAEAVRGALPRLPPVVERFVDGALAQIVDATPPTVAGVGDAVGVGSATLRRRWPEHGFPRPKEFLTWIEVLLVVKIWAIQRQSIGSAARELGMDGQALRRRLQHLGLRHLARLDGDAAWATALAAFRNRCASRRAGTGSDPARERECAMAAS